MQSVVYARLAAHKHKLLMSYLRANGLTMTAFIESLVDQILIQIAPSEFEAPEWLVQAILRGDLPFELPAEQMRSCQLDEGHLGNVVGIRRG